MTDLHGQPEVAAIITPESHPSHHTVGRRFRGWNGQTYRCDSYDPSCGYWMTNVNDPGDRRNVSERAIGRTFHEQGNRPCPTTSTPS